jgi:hypothetical protein
VFSSAELIEALRRRSRRSLRPETPPGEFPPGWRAWFIVMRERVGAITGAPADAIVALLALREPRMPPRRLPQLSPPQAFAALWPQEWFPAPGDERAQRIVAFAIALLLQVFFSILLLWLAYARFGGEPPARQGEDVVQVEFIGEGTPREQGGGAPAGAVATPAAAASSRRAAAAASASASRASSQAAPAAAAQAAPQGEAPSQPAPAAPQQVQQVQVTESTQPDATFTLPPPSERAVVVPQAQVQVPQLAQAPEALRAVELPSPIAAKQLTAKLPGAHVAVPALGTAVEALPSPAPPLPGVALREARARTAQVRMPALGASPESLPSPAPPMPGVAERSVALPQAKVGMPGLRAQAESLPGTLGAGAESAASSGTAASGSAASGASPVAGGAASSAGGANSANAGAGAGPKPAATPGAWSTAKAGDDWGASDRNRSGGQSGNSGLFDENGRPRLAPGTSAAAGGGLPPGMVEEDIQDLDRAGTWLKRKNPLPYEPTAFDRYWLPGETLLQEWVRRGVREVQIRIPGTSKKIHCVVSLLQLGGGCGIDDPNMQDQEATARKPPDVPYKPELQEK